MTITTIYYFSGLPSFFITTTTTTTVTFSSLKTTISEAEPIVATAYEVVSVSAIIVSFLCQSISVLLVCLTSLSCTNRCVEVQRVDKFCTLFLAALWNIRTTFNLLEIYIVKINVEKSLLLCQRVE